MNSRIFKVKHVNRKKHQATASIQFCWKFAQTFTYSPLLRFCDCSLFHFYYITCKDANETKRQKNFLLLLRAAEGDTSNSYDYHNLYGLRGSRVLYGYTKSKSMYLRIWKWKRTKEEFCLLIVSRWRWRLPCRFVTPKSAQKRQSHLTNAKYSDLGSVSGSWKLYASTAAASNKTLYKNNFHSMNRKIAHNCLSDSGA